MNRSAALTCRVALLGLALVVLSGPARAVGPDAAPLALVVGNAGYADRPALPACAAAATQAAQALQRLGYRVMEARDLSFGQLAAAVMAFTRAAEANPGAGRLAYFCGDAVEFDRRLFLLPVSARLSRPAEAVSQGMLATAFAWPALQADAAGLVLIDIMAPLADADAAARFARGGAANDGAGVVLRTGLSRGATAPLSIALADLAGEAAGPLPPAALRLRLSPPIGPTPMASRPSPAGISADSGTGPAAPAAPAIPEGSANPETPLGLEAAPSTQAAASASPARPDVIDPPVSAEAESQEAPHDAMADEVTGPDSVAAQPDATALPEAPPAPPSAEARLSLQQRRAIQVVLEGLGYYAGRPDGVFGPGARGGISRYQREIGEPTGDLTTSQIARLLATRQSRGNP